MGVCLRSRFHATISQGKLIYFFVVFLFLLLLLFIYYYYLFFTFWRGLIFIGFDVKTGILCYAKLDCARQTDVRVLFLLLFFGVFLYGFYDVLYYIGREHLFQFEYEIRRCGTDGGDNNNNNRPDQLVLQPSYLKREPVI